MGADNIFYRDAFLKCKVINDNEGNLKLGIDFPIYHMTVCYNNTCRYCYLAKDLQDKEVLVYIHYAIADEEKVMAFEGYLGNDWSIVAKNSDVAKFWAVKKEDAFAKVIINPISQLETVEKYSGQDKLEIAHPYLADDNVFKKRRICTDLYDIE